MRFNYTRGWALSNGKQKGCILPLALAVIVMTAVDVFAEGGGAAAPRWADFGWRVLNFVLFAGILWYFAGVSAVKFFRGRRQGIRETLDNLEERRRKASEGLTAVEKRIAGLNGEREAILAESRAQAEVLRQGIIEEAQRQAALIIEQAGHTVENEGRAVLSEVRAVIADEIVAAAQKVLAEKLDGATHEKFIAKSLNKVVLQ
ncbi:ATP synthase F0 subunit B [Candidatus Desulfovibrio trichonymphae]|uniref:ATP synthase F0 subunit B n=1 Tax=Candidatus Desulfovibrio trichonymphae TaxID=1725232 RepID=UPI001E5F345E|nr:ATP synthase F0 subunit B [Candidatus Desulfovibrio trichonymphae]